MSFKDDIKGKNVLVFGLGIQGGGVGDALWLHQNGANVRVTDRKNSELLSSSLSRLPEGITTTLGEHKKEDIDWAELIIKNPGVPDDSEYISYARSRNLPILTSIEVFVREGRLKSIGITGTRGKSTTTELIFQVLNSRYPGKIIRGGNIPGTSGLSLLDQLVDSEYAVLELSSFQLHSFHLSKLSPHIAVITNIYPDHLNRYPSMEEYVGDKLAICAYQANSDVTIVNGENTEALSLAKASKGKIVEFFGSDIPSDWKISIPGKHNLENIAATLAVSRILNISIEQVKKVVEDFHGLPFRIENRGTISGITYLNDTTSTTPTATIKAVESLTSPTCLILGGDEKHLPFDSLLQILKSSQEVQKIVLLGCKNIPKFVDSLKSSVGEKIVGQVYSMSAAVGLARNCVKDGWNILLSPGFASFDLFQNEFDRGRQFNEEIEKLKLNAET